MKNKKNKKTNKAVIIFILLILIIIGSGFIIIKTDIFYIKEIIVENNYELDDGYIIKKSSITENDNIFLINLENIKRNLESEIYIKEVEIKRKLPDILKINVIERTGRINYSFNDTHYLLDFDGIVLKEINKDEELFLIKSDIEINRKLGEKIHLDKSNIKFEKILNLSKYIYENNETLNCHILMKKNNFYCIIENNTYIKLDIEESLEYQYEFGLDIIERRKNKGETVEGVIDFTKGENPIYVDFKDLEENI